ncbi:LysR substrate-binding domain-containing protein [Sphingomonas quercus]|uniref:LysR family transcriptional regulator n=1 Tax=Sphingomonas quercus TaxID=2842451 RepID=A0ABS6BL18_9SPHN|nr:LysR substrate-binding domain-containing protein [Sphingomonas quercus]MBU3079007.1 LysR family transcriptional regulator [Sphingomonas quercus]
MTLEQLRIFVRVAELEHVTRAAEALNITQSAASAAIAALEARHGVALFHRVGRRIELTDAGQILLVEARAVLGRAASAAQALADLGALKRGTLRLVASQTIASYWLPRHLAAFRLRYPSVDVQLAIANTDRAAEAVRNGTAELGFVEGVIDDPALALWPIAADRLMLVAAEEGPLSVDAPWLRAARWIMREPGSGTRSSFEEALRGLGVEPAALDVALVLPSNEAVRSAVEAGAGVAALSALVVAPSVATGALAALPLTLPGRPFFGLRHKERYRSRAADALLDLIRETICAQGAGGP